MCLAVDDFSGRFGNKTSRVFVGTGHAVWFSLDGVKN